MSEKEATEEELELVDGMNFAAAELDDASIMSAEELDDDTPPEAKKKMKRRLEAEANEPQMADPEWAEWVMRQFAEDELDPDGRPFVHGLRRVARKVLGPILESCAKVVQGPQFLTGALHESKGHLTPTVVEYTVRILMCRGEQGMSEAYETLFTDAADVTHLNTDPDYARHATAVAATKAESRCLRKALQINGVAAEEKTLVPVPINMDGMIDEEQIQFLDMLCKRNDINLLKYINIGKVKYDRIEDVPCDKASGMAEHLSGLQNDRKKIKPEWKGYDKNWRTKR